MLSPCPPQINPFSTYITFPGSLVYIKALSVTSDRMDTKVGGKNLTIIYHLSREALATAASRCQVMQSRSGVSVPRFSHSAWPAFLARSSSSPGNAVILLPTWAYCQHILFLLLLCQPYWPSLSQVLLLEPVIVVSWRGDSPPPGQGHVLTPGLLAVKAPPKLPWSESGEGVLYQRKRE